MNTFSTFLNTSSKLKLNGYVANPQQSIRWRKQYFKSYISRFAACSHIRQFHAYCIGTPKSGTHSIANMLSSHYRSAHEPMYEDTIFHLWNWKQGNYSDAKIENIFRLRDKLLCLDLEATHFLYHAVDILLKLNPEAKFILAVREPLSWIESEINQRLWTANNPFWDTLSEMRYGCYGENYSHYDSDLKSFKGIYPVANYFTYWRDHNELLAAKIPAHNLLILETNNISQSVVKIANFLQINVDSIDITQSHSYRGEKRKRLNLAELIDKSFLQEQAALYCSEFINRYSLRF